MLSNLNTIRNNGLAVLQTDGGWSAVVRLARIGITSERLLLDDAVIVHPGSFYGMPEVERVVVSLITPLTVFSEGIRRIAKVAHQVWSEDGFSTS
jgi:aspartate/methionine/tyrosine aminotransferase